MIRSGAGDRDAVWWHGIIIPVVAVFSVPLLLMLLSSFKSAEELARNPFGLWPESWNGQNYGDCLLYTSPSPRDATLSRMPSSA